MLGVIGVFNSAMELQAKTATMVNVQIAKNQNVLDPKAQLQTQIDQLNISIAKQEDRIDRESKSGKPDWSLSEAKWYLSQDKTRLDKLTTQIEALQAPKSESKPEVMIENQLVLDIYNIFGQIAVRIGADRAIFSFWFIVCMAFLVELIIFSTTPRKHI